MCEVLRLAAVLSVVVWTRVFNPWWGHITHPVWNIVLLFGQFCDAFK